MRMLSLLALVLALDPRPLDPSLPEAARLHAARIGATTMVPDGMMLHRFWQIQPPAGPGELEEFIGRHLMRLVVRFPAFAQPFEMFDQVGDRVVRRSFSGWVENVEGQELAGVLTEDAMGSEGWLFGGAKVLTLGPADGGTLLRVIPKQGLAALILVSPNGDLLWAQIPEEHPTAMLTYDRWISDGGVVRPGGYVFSRPAEPGQTPVTSVLTRSELIPEAPLPPLAGIDWHWDAGAQRAEIPFADDTIALEIGGKPERFTLDTGSSLSSFDTSLGQRLGLTPLHQITHSSGSLPTESYVQTPEIRVGPATLEPHIVKMADWKATQMGVGHSGIIGSDFFSRAVLVIDYPASHMELREASSFRPQDDDVAIPCERRNSSLFVPVKISGREGLFLVDTGAGNAAVVTHVRDQLGLVTDREKGSYNAESVGRSFSCWPSWVDLSVGPFRWKRALVVVSDPATFKGDEIPGDGVIGLSFWSHFRVTIDFEEGRLWLKQLVPFGEHEDDCALGLGFQRINGTPTITSVAKGGAAAAAGLREGDVLRSVNGKASLVDYRPPCKVGEPVAFEVIRDGGATTIKVIPTLIP